MRKLSVSEGVRDIRVTTSTVRVKIAFPTDGAESKYLCVPKNRMRAVDASSERLRRHLEMIASYRISGMEAGCALYA